MPKHITSPDQIKPGDIYEDSFYHPCLCTEVSDYSIFGISLIDGSYPRGEDIELSGVRKLTIEEAVIWKIKGPEMMNDENW